MINRNLFFYNCGRFFEKIVVIGVAILLGRRWRKPIDQFPKIKPDQKP